MNYSRFVIVLLNETVVKIEEVEFLIEFNLFYLFYSESLQFSGSLADNYRFVFSAVDYGGVD